MIKELCYLMGIYLIIIGIYFAADLLKYKPKRLHQKHFKMIDYILIGTVILMYLVASFIKHLDE